MNKLIDSQLARFLIVGVVSNALNFLAYHLVHVAGAQLMVASTFGYMVGLLNSYHLGRVWVFEAKKHSARTAPLRFAMVYTIGGAGMSVIIGLLNQKLGWDYRVCWFFGALFAFANNFIGSKWLVYKEGKQ